MFRKQSYFEQFLTNNQREPP